MNVLVFRDQILLGFQRPEGLSAAGRPSLRVPEDGQPVHRQGGGVGRGQLHLRREERDDQRHRLQLPDAGGGAPGR